MDLLQYFDLINKATVPVVLVAILWAIKERWIVPGWVYNACEERANKLEEIVNSHAAKIELKLDKLEEQRWGSKATHERP